MRNGVLIPLYELVIAMQMTATGLGWMADGKTFLGVVAMVVVAFYVFFSLTGFYRVWHQRRMSRDVNRQLDEAMARLERSIP